MSDTNTFVNDTILCSTYDELLELFDDDNTTIVNVFGPPPPETKVNGEWVWKEQPQMEWIVDVKAINQMDLFDMESV